MVPGADIPRGLSHTKETSHMTMILIIAGLAACCLMLGISHNFTLTWTRNNERLSTTVVMSEDAEQNFDVTVPGSGNVVVAAEIDVSALQSVYITSDQTITLATNDDGSPDDTLTITASKPLAWYTGCGLPNPFASAVDIESFKLTRGSAGDATVKIRFLQDPTP